MENRFEYTSFQFPFAQVLQISQLPDRFYIHNSWEVFRCYNYFAIQEVIPNPRVGWHYSLIFVSPVVNRTLPPCCPSLHELKFLLFVTLWMSLLPTWLPPILSHLCGISSLLVTRDPSYVALGMMPPAFARGFWAYSHLGLGNSKRFPIA